MFTTKEVKSFIVRFGEKWLFPDFHNKVTWYVVTLGAGVILAPVPLKLAFYNWIINSFNLNSGQNITLAELGSSNSDYWLGFLLIAIALLHNTFSKWLLHQEAIEHRHGKAQVHEVDQKLFKEFLVFFSSDSRSAYLLDTHDFGNSFSRESLRDIDKFVDEWNQPEKHFIDPTLNAMRQELWDLSHKFVWLIAQKTAPVRGGLQSVVSDHHKDEWNWPEWLLTDIKEVNESATAVFQCHQKYIKDMRSALMC